MNTIYYPAVFHKDENSYWVEFPDLEGCLTEGDTLEEAFAMAKDALGTYLDTSEDIYNNHFKKPSTLDQIVNNYPNETVLLVDFNSLTYKKFIKSKAVKKTLSIPQWLNDEAIKQDVNFSQVLQDALINKLHLD